MGRAERRRQERESIKAKTRTYNLTREQLESVVESAIQERLAEINKSTHDVVYHDAINTSMILLLALPMKVLMDHYWKRSYAHRVPKFTERVLEYYRKWQDGEIDMDKLTEELWEYAGVRLVEE